MFLFKLLFFGIPILLFILAIVVGIIAITTKKFPDENNATEYTDWELEEEIYDLELQEEEDQMRWNK